MSFNDLAKKEAAAKKASHTNDSTAHSNSRTTGAPKPAPADKPSK